MFLFFLGWMDEAEAMGRNDGEWEISVEFGSQKRRDEMRGGELVVATFPAKFGLRL